MEGRFATFSPCGDLLCPYGGLFLGLPPPTKISAGTHGGVQSFVAKSTLQHFFGQNIFDTR